MSPLRSLLSSLLSTLLLLAGSAALADGLIVIHDPPHRIPGHHTFAPLSIKYHHVTVRITDQIATTEVDQVFYNPSDRRLEGTYIFPIPKNAQIDKLMMDVNGKLQEAELLDAAKARGIYEDIVRRALDPALLEYVGQGLFKLRIFPIEPRSEKRIRLSYTQLLKSDSGLVDYTYPLNTEKFSSQPLESVSLKVTLETSRPLKALYSPTHEVEIQRRNGRQAVVGFEAKRVKPDTDFQLLFSTQPTSEIGLNVLTYRDDSEPEGYFLLLASPPAQSGAVVKKDVVFVLDTSGSMAEGGKLDQAKRALNFCLANLNDGDRFEVVRFSTETEPLFERLTTATEANREKAKAFLRDLKPIGGTAIDEALATALRNARDGDASRPFMVVFLTDGRPTIGATQESEILDRALKGAGSRTTRIFCFGIGTDVNTHLLDELAERSRAAAQYVLPKEDIEVKVSSFYAKISHPVLADPKLAIPEGLRLSRTYPQALPDLFRGEQLVVVGRYKGNQETTVSIRGTVNGEARTFSEKAVFPAKATEHSFIPKLWATRRIGFLLDEIRLRGESAELRNEITELARRYGILTPYTSYLIVEDEARRNLPMQSRILQEEETLSVVRESAAKQYKGVNASRSGDMAVGGAQAFDAMKRAKTLAAPAAANMASQEALRGAEAEEGKRLQTVLSAQKTRTLAGRTFYQNGSQWIDASAQAGARLVKVRFNSPEYFELSRKHPHAAQWLSVGRNVRFQLGETLYDVTD
jgi:Ca-activated chloride channel family protein